MPPSAASQNTGMLAPSSDSCASFRVWAALLRAAMARSRKKMEHKAMRLMTMAGKVLSKPARLAVQPSLWASRCEA